MMSTAHHHQENIIDVELDVNKLDADTVLVTTADHIRIALPMKVAQELHCLKPQIKNLGNSVMFSLHFNARVLQKVSEFISLQLHARDEDHMTFSSSMTNDQSPRDSEISFIKTLATDDNLLAEVFVAAESLRDESIRSGDHHSMLTKMADFIYSYGPRDLIVDTIMKTKPFSSFSRLEAVFRIMTTNAATSRVDRPKADSDHLPPDLLDQQGPHPLERSNDPDHVESEGHPSYSTT